MTMNENIIYLSSFVILIISSSMCTYKFQKDFTNLSKPSAPFIFLLMTIIITIVSVILLEIVDIFKINNTGLNLITYSNIQSYADLNLQNKSDGIISIISFINFLFYFAMAFALFYFIEESNLNSNYKNYELNEENEVLEENSEFLEDLESKTYLKSNNNVNSNFTNENQPFNLNLLKNYIYYLIAFAALNIIYLILYKMNYLNFNTSMKRYSLVPDDLLKTSLILDDLEILNYVNFGIILMIGKFLTICYVPYGAGKLTSALIKKLKGEENFRKEYNSLNNNFSKNYETIKFISEKVLQGRSLTKKEKQILKSCKETDTILHHKQEILEDKYSNIKVLLNYLLIPVKFLFIFLSIIFVLLFVGTKIVLQYTELTSSTCGIDCGYITDWTKVGFSLQSVLKIMSQSLIIISLLFVMTYLIIFTVKGMSKLGLSLFSKNILLESIRSNRLYTFVFYSVFFVICLNLIFETFSSIPDISFFNNTGIQSICKADYFIMNNCTISSFGIFYTKLFVNFHTFKYADMIMSFGLVCLMAFMIIYFPVTKLIKTEKNERKEKNKLIK